MATLYLVGSIVLMLFGMITQSSADYFTYEVYDSRQGYPNYNEQKQYQPAYSQPIYNQYNQYQQQSYPQPSQPNYNTYSPKQEQQIYQNIQQQNPSYSVANAEWVCTNPKTNYMMIIASEDVPAPRQNQWQQPNYQTTSNNQPLYPQPQQTYPQNQVPVNQPGLTQPQQPAINPSANLIYSTTEAPYIWSNDNDKSTPLQLVPNYSTTKKPIDPIWSEPNNHLIQVETKPSYSTTEKSPIWSDLPSIATQKPTTNPTWPDDDNRVKPGFTVVLPTSSPKPSTKRPPEIQDPMGSENQPTQKPNTSSHGQSDADDDDEGGIEIVMGKK